MLKPFPILLPIILVVRVMVCNSLSSFLHYCRYNSVVLALLLIVASNATAERGNPSVSDKPQLRFRQFLNGLSQSNARCIVQDSLGFIWIGTEGGLNRFDGMNFQVYEANNSDSTSLPDNRINDLLIDKKNNLWVATYGAVVRYDYRTNSFVHYLFADNQPNEVTVALSLLSDSNGKLWIGTHQGIYVFDEEQKKLIKSSYSNSPELENLVVSKIYEDRSQRIWVGTWEGLHVLFPEDKMIKKISSWGEQLSSAIITDITQDHQDDLWISTKGRGVFRIHAEEHQPKVYHYSSESSNPHSLKSDQVFSLLEDHNQRIWVGTETAGLNLYVPEIDGFIAYRKEVDEKNALKSNSIWEVFEDDAHRLWIGTFNQGVFLHDDMASKFNRVDQGYGHNLRLNSPVVSSFLEDGNNIWVGTDGGGISVWNRLENATHRFYGHSPQDNLSLGSNAVLCLFRDSEGLIWVGTWGGGVSLYDSISDNFIALKSSSTTSNSLGSNNVFGIDEDSHGNLWMSTWGSGITCYQKSDGSFLNIKSGDVGKDMLSSSMTYDVEVDDLNGDVWVATLLGLNRISFSNDSSFTVKKYPYGSANAPESVSGDRVICILEDTQHRIWIGTNNGLNIFNRQEETFTKFFKKDGLPGNFIKAVIEDNIGQFWVTTNKGLAKMENTPQGWVIDSYDPSDGLPGKEFFINAAYQASDGEIFLGGVSGFNHFSPNDIQPNPHLPKLQFTGFKLFNEDVTIGGEDSPLQVDINAAQQITLTHDQSVFSIEYQGVSFTHPEKNQYAFMLKGFESEWNYVGSQTRATYTNLDPGQYTFMLKGANNDGVWNPQARELSIVILPPWWETWWFHFLLFLGISLMILTILQVRLSVIQKQKRILENKVALRTAEVTEQKREIEKQAAMLRKTNEQKNKLFSIISHDLRSPLTSLQAITTLLDPEILQKEDLENTRNEISQRINNLSDMMNGLLSWAKQQMEGEKTSPQSFDLSVLSQEVIRLYEEQAVAKEVSLKSQVEPSSLVFGDINQVRTVLRNLVGNAVKFTNRGEMVVVSSKLGQAGKMTVVVQDTGVGMDQEKAENLFDIHSESTVGTSGEKGVGLGLILAREFVEKNGGKIWAESQPGEGSTFYFTLPLGQLASATTSFTQV